MTVNPTWSVDFATDPRVDAVLARADCAVAIGVSGGKDSQAAVLATIAHLDAIGHAGPRVPATVMKTVDALATGLC